MNNLNSSFNQSDIKITRQNLLDFEWLQKRLTTTNILQLINDFARFQEDEVLCTLKNTLQLSVHVLLHDKSALGSQLVGRLSENSALEIDQLLTQIDSVNSRNLNWLRSCTASLTNPNGSLLYTIHDHKDGIYKVAISPHGKTVVSHGNTLVIWNFPYGYISQTICRSYYRGRVAITSDGQFLIANASDKKLKVWRMPTLEETDSHILVKSEPLIYRHMTCFAISPDNKFLAATLEWSIEFQGKTFVLFELSGNEPPILNEGNLYTRFVEDMTFTPDNRFVIVGSASGVLTIWDIYTKDFYQFEAHDKSILAVAVAPNGQYFASASSNGELKIWDMKTYQEIATLSGHKESINSLTITPDNRFIISASNDKSLIIWDVSQRKKAATFYGHSSFVNDVVVTPNGQQAISASSDATLKVWDLTRLQHKDDHPANSYDRHLNTVHDLVVTPNGKKVVSASEDETLKVWDVATGQLLHTLVGHEHVVCAIAITTDGQKVVSASGDKTLKVWDLEQGDELYTLTGHHRFVTDVVVMPGTHIAISASDDATLKVWNLDDGKEIMTLAGYPDSAKHIAIATDGSNLISAAGKTSDSREMIKVWDLKNGNEKYQLTGTRLKKDDHMSRMGEMSAILLSSDGVHLVARIDAHKLIVWDWKNRVEICTISAPSNPAYTFLGFEAVVFTLDNQQIITGSTDGTIRLYDKMSGKEMRAFAGHAASVNTLALMPDGKRFVSASKDQSLKVWNVDSGEHVATFYGDGIFTTCVVAPNGTIIAGEATGRIHFLELMGV